jgi:hypothetical protein
MIEALVERNSKLEEENERLGAELRIIQGRFTDSSPASQYSEAADESNGKSPAKFDRITNS